MARHALGVLRRGSGQRLPRRVAGTALFLRRPCGVDVLGFLVRHSDDRVRVVTGKAKRENPSTGLIFEMRFAHFVLQYSKQ